MVSWFLWPYWPKSEVKKTFTYLLNGFSVHCLCHSYLCLNYIFMFTCFIYFFIVLVIPLRFVFVCVCSGFSLASWCFTPMERRRDDVVLCRARIGHAYFTNGYLLRGELRPMCCNTRLTVRHVLLSCAKYAHIRRKYFAFNSLFELFRDTPAGFIIQFLRECNLYYMF